MAENINFEENNEEQQNLSDKLDIKQENEEYHVILQIKPENEIDNGSNDVDNPYESLQLEIKQEEPDAELAEVLSNVESTLSKKLSEYESAVAQSQYAIKMESQTSHIISDDYPSLDEGSIDSNEATALNNVEACLQEDVNVKIENFNFENTPKEYNSVKQEMDMTVTETNLISNKVINTTSTVTMPCEGFIESQTTKTLVMEIHPMLHMRNTMHKLGNPEEILPTSYNDEYEYQDVFQLNSITGNILSLEQEAYGLLKAKKKIMLDSTHPYKCEKCDKTYKLANSLKKHMLVHDKIERRAMGVLKGLQKKKENKNVKDDYKKPVIKQKLNADNLVNNMARKERLERRLKNITEGNPSTTKPQQKVKKKVKKKHKIPKVEMTNEEVPTIKVPKLENGKKDCYKCTCGQVFQRRSRMETCLRSHNIDEETSSNYPCVSCLKQFQNKDELALHRKRLHRKRFPCKFCPTDYNTRKELFKHLQIHQKVQLMEYKVISEVVKGKKKLKCFMCSKTYSELSDLKSHVMEDHKEPYTCQHCDATFVKIIDFGHHTKAFHPAIGGKSVLDVLEAFSKLVKAWKCEECDLQFHEADKLAMHQIEKHSPELKADSQVQCLDCHRVFINQKGLTSHRRIHHNIDNVEETGIVEEGVLCIECRKVCKDVEALTSHMRLHSPERKYPCKYCDFRFTTPEKRKAHSEIHTGDMKYVCFICEYQCSSENRLRQHKESVKHISMKEFLSSGNSTVQVEPSTSTREPSVKEDLIEVKRKKKDKSNLLSLSSNEEEVTCDVCGDKFSSTKKMLRHKEKHPFIEFPNEDKPTRIFFK